MEVGKSRPECQNVSALVGWDNKGKIQSTLYGTIRT